jgi:NAD-dependent deacetylase
VALTGAGISVESGIPPFRGKGGLWEKIDPMKYAHIDALEADPEEVWRVLFMGIGEILLHARPNAGHTGLRRLEELGVLQTVITQNVDGLHQKAGSGDVIEFHGSHAVLRCMRCSQRFDWQAVPLEKIPPVCACGAFLRPDVIMFGEPIDMGLLQRSQMLAAQCDVMLVVGTSATVQPAAYLPVIAKRNGACIIEINPEPTELTHHISDLTLLGPAGAVMDALVGKVEKLR